MINEYQAGQGIHAHEDGGAYYPVVATVSLGAPIVLDIYVKPAQGEGMDRRPSYRILQEPRSLLVSMGEMYTSYLHGIAEKELDEDLRPGDGGICNWGQLSEEWRGNFEGGNGMWKRDTRVSLTFRDVLKVKSLGKGLGFLAKN